jgi:ferredoxin/flavodoxin---NADP+ reductase
MATWNTGKVVEHKQWGPTLHTLYVESEIEPYQAGQFVKIGLEIDGLTIAHPYSLCNAPQQRPLEFYYVEVPNGALTSQLVKLKAGDEILVSPRANGFMVLDEVPAGKHLWLMATGTGVGPFLSMLDTEQPWQRFEKVILVYAVRTVAELSYQARIAAVQATYGEQFVFIPFISREQTSFSMEGRIPQAIENGSLEARAGISLSPENSQLMLCGNPAMIEETQQVLTTLGLRKHRRREPGHITVENYW